MLRVYHLLFLAIILFTSSYPVHEIKVPDKKDDTTHVRLIFVGDVMGHMPQINAAYVDSVKGYDYKSVFEYIAPILKRYDAAIANLEVPLAGKPYSGYPQFSSPDELARDLKATGFNFLITSNNHAVDRGTTGLIRTLNVLDSVGLHHTGTFRDSIEKSMLSPYIMDINNIKIALLNYTYGTNGLKADKPAIVNYIDTTAIRNDITASYNRGADFVIVTLHWGIEYERNYNDWQKSIAMFIEKCGAQAIVGGHPHVVEPFVKYYPANGDSSQYFPVIYSVGNFYSNQRDRYRDGGIMYELDLEKKETTRITACKFLPVWVFKGLVNGKMTYKLIPPENFSDAYKALKISSADSTKCNEFYSDTREHLKNLPEITDLPAQSASNLP